MSRISQAEELGGGGVGDGDDDGGGGCGIADGHPIGRRQVGGALQNVIGVCTGPKENALVAGGDVQAGKRKGQFKHRADEVGAAMRGGSIKVAVIGLDQSGMRTETVVAAGEGIKRGQCAAGGEPKNHAPATGAATHSASIKIAIAGLQQGSFRIVAVRAIGEVVKDRHDAAEAKTEN